MFELFDLIPAWIRVSLACAMIAFGGWSSYTGYSDYEQLDAEQTETMTAADPYAMQSAKSRFQFGLVATLMGATLLAISGRSKAEKNGYRSI